MTPAPDNPADADADQEMVFAFLGDPGTHRSVASVERIDTHGAAVFLAGPDVYKVKRAVRFPFMDFSTLEKRRIACEAEVEVNRANAPDLYLGVTPIAQSAHGLALGGSGDVVEWAVHLRRFDEDATLDRLADKGALSRELIRRLARAIARSHEGAPRRDGDAALKALASYLDQNEAAFAADPGLFEPSRAAQLARDARAALDAAKSLLIERGASGWVRRCHGDLHLRNIVVIDGEPVLFDAVEFDDAIATGDVLYDLAFTLMDLEERSLRWASNLLLNRYLWETTDDAQVAGLAALPLFLSIRSAIRAKVVAAGLKHLSGSAQDQARREAERYFWFSEEFLKPAPARLIAVGGLSGVGKSAVAAELAAAVGRAPGAILLRSDIERKRLLNVEETERLPKEAYDGAVTRAVYEHLCKKASAVLATGASVVVDAVHLRLDEREAIADVARRCAAPFSGVWLEAPLPVRLQRARGRRNDASDADADVIRSQHAIEPGTMNWARVDASNELATTTKAALAALRVGVTKRSTISPDAP
jgi:aminoglycoside phosphotransferase family enzyme/predicted kinase